MKSVDQIFEEHIASLSEEERQQEYLSLLKQQVIWSLYQSKQAALSERMRTLIEQFRYDHV